MKSFIGDEEWWEALLEMKSGEKLCWRWKVIKSFVGDEEWWKVLLESLPNLRLPNVRHPNFRFPNFRLPNFRLSNFRIPNFRLSNFFFFQIFRILVSNRALSEILKRSDKVRQTRTLSKFCSIHPIQFQRPLERVCYIALCYGVVKDVEVANATIAEEHHILNNFYSATPSITEAKSDYSDELSLIWKKSAGVFLRGRG